MTVKNVVQSASFNWHENREIIFIGCVTCKFHGSTGLIQNFWLKLTNFGCISERKAHQFGHNFIEASLCENDSSSFLLDWEQKQCSTDSCRAGAASRGDDCQDECVCQLLSISSQLLESARKRFLFSSVCECRKNDYFCKAERGEVIVVVVVRDPPPLPSS